MITIYTEQTSHRLAYICEHLFKTVLGHELRITTDASEKADIRYANTPQEGTLTIRPNGLLFEEDIHKQTIEGITWEGLPAFFATDGDIPFDLFSAAFYLLTRYEEYTSELSDKHGRFTVQESASFKLHFLEEPLIDLWANKLTERLPQLGEPENPPHFTYLPTIDVDNVFAFRNHGLTQTLFYLMKDALKGRRKRAKLRLKVVLRKKEDPYFNLEEVAKMHQGLPQKPHFFYHCGCFGEKDKGVIYPSRRYKAVRQALDNIVVSGLHPSYNASKQLWRLRMENNALKKCLGKEPLHNRFHYLRFTLPDTYETLIQEGFTTDWSLCYSNNPGFRASTSFPFRFFNLKRNEVRPLLLYPTVVMDKSLRNNLHLSLEDSKQYLLNLSDKVKSVNGTFITLFHNEHLTDELDWEGWKGLCQEIIDAHKE